ncbi:MAG: glutaredoxin family protein [Rhabdochlamydiaceae bacterium]
MLFIPFLLIIGYIDPSSMPLGVAEKPRIQLIALYYSPKCPHSQKVLSYISSHKLSVPLKDVTQDEQAKEELRTMGGYMVVPCLIVDGKPIYQDKDIIEWLSEHEFLFRSATS